MTDKRLPSNIPWPEMEDYVDTADALVMAWVSNDEVALGKILDDFVQPYIDAGKARIFIQMLAYSMATTMQAICEVHDLDLVETLVITNAARKNTFAG